MPSRKLFIWGGSRGQPGDEKSHDQDGKSSHRQSPFYMWFSTLVFITGSILGVTGATITKTETVQIRENDQIVQEEIRTTQGDLFIQQVGFAMSGLAAGSVFFNYAPGFIESALSVLGGALSGAARAIDQNSEEDE
ncbi:MAG: hypothetical protein AAGA75_15685 [Cyanobacteria bacterium P01_E01_bin.6]